MEDCRVIPKRLKYWTDKEPNRTAFIFVGAGNQRTVLTRRRVYDEALEFGRHLQQLGLKPGDVVCNALPDSPQSIIALFGIANVGCVILNATTVMSDSTFLLENINKSKCRALILSSDPNDVTSKNLKEHFKTTSGSNNVTSDKLPHLKNVIFAKYSMEVVNETGFLWDDELSSSAMSSPNPPVSPTDGFSIAITSGTTGNSKLLLHSHNTFTNLNLFHKILKFIKASEDTPVTLVEPNKLSWLWGLPFWFTQTGHPAVYFDNRFPAVDESAQLKLIRDSVIREKCQVGKFSTAMCLQLHELNENDGIDYSNWPLKVNMNAGQPLKANFLKVLGTFIGCAYNLYGSSECGFISMKEIKPGTIFEDFNTGFVEKGVEVKIVDENLQPVTRGELGQILVKSPSSCLEFIGDENALIEKFTPDGWYMTKDSGCLKENGELIVLGRYDDVIMRGIHYYHPSWIESIIGECPGVAQVAIVKVPDEALFSEICACFIPTSVSGATVESLKAFCEEKFVSSVSTDKTPCPKYYLKMESFPVNANGKLKRFELEKTAAKILNLE